MLRRSDPHQLILINGSTLTLGGFEDKERTEKLLGTEYLDIYFNEVSQIGYATAELALSRLAFKGALFNKAFFDCNPPSPMHWAHRMFIEKVNPKSGEPYKDGGMYQSLLMNPIHNVANLPNHYIENVLHQLSENMRRRMEDGEWVKPEGSILDKLSESDIIDIDDVPPLEDFAAGVDFGLNMGGVLHGFAGDAAYALCTYGGWNMVASTWDREFRSMSVEIPRTEGDTRKVDTKLVSDVPYVAYCDPAGGERINEITNGMKADNSVEPGLDYWNTLIEHGLYKMLRTCRGLIGEVFDYRRDEKGRIIKENDHFCDAARYCLYSRHVIGRPGITSA